MVVAGKFFPCQRLLIFQKTAHERDLKAALFEEVEHLFGRSAVKFGSAKPMLKNDDRFAAPQGFQCTAQHEDFAAFYVNFYQINLKISRKQVVESLCADGDERILFVRMVVVAFEQAAVRGVTHDVIETRSPFFVGQSDIEQAAVFQTGVFFLQTFKQVGYRLEAVVCPLRSVLQEQIHDFTLVTTYVEAIATGFADALDDAARLPVVALILGERDGQGFQKSLDRLFQNRNQVEEG